MVLRLMTACLLSIITITVQKIWAAQTPVQDSINFLVAIANKTADTSYSAALQYYEEAASIVRKLPDGERANLAITLSKHVTVSSSVLVDSIVPLARRRALAESDIFECVLWIGSQFPLDSCYDPVTGITRRDSDCPKPRGTSDLLLWNVFRNCLDANREDLARRIDFRLFSTIDTADIYSSLVGAACRAGDRARAMALLDTAIQFIEGKGLCWSRNYGSALEEVFDKYAFLLARDRQVDLLNRYAACVDTTKAKRLWNPFGFVSRQLLQLGELQEAESCGIKAARHWMLGGLPELEALYSQYRSTGDSTYARRILDTILSLVEYVPGGGGYLDEEFLIQALRENGRIDEADRLFFDREARELATFDPPLDFNISTANFGRYVRFHKLERGKFVLDSLSAGIADGSIEIEKSIEVVRGYCSLKLYSGAERLLQNLGRTTIASKCALAAVSWISGDPYFFQTERFVQYIADIPTRDSAWLSTINSGEGDRGFRMAAERCRKIVSDEIRLAAITRLAPDIWMGAYDTDIEAEANELCTKVGNLSLAYEWYIRMFKGSSSYYEMAKARFYLTKREEFLRVNQNAQGFRVFSEYYLDLAEDYASCSLIDKAKELIAEYVLPQADDDMLRVRIVTAYGNIGAIDLALKIVAEMDDPYDRGQALANVACLARSTSVKSDRECTGYLHTIIQTTENNLKK